MAFRVSPSRYRLLTFAAIVSLVAIVITGALVRLTKSGLGCIDWPNCNNSEFIDVSSKHAAIEQINRLITGIVAVAVVLVALGAFFRSPRRRDLMWLSIALVLGVPAQAVLGAIVVWSDLNPFAVQSHFLLSMVLLAAAMVLHRRAALPDSSRFVSAVEPRTRLLSWLVVAATSLALLAGTVVTGAGPHSGSVDDEPVQRFDVAIPLATKFHSLLVWCALGTAFALLLHLRKHPIDRAYLDGAITLFLGLGFAQGAVGYIQYFSDVPVPLVAVHVALATAVWLAAMNLGLSSRSAQPSTAMINTQDSRQMNQLFERSESERPEAVSEARQG
jgi:heme a synthase